MLRLVLLTANSVGGPATESQNVFCNNNYFVPFSVTVARPGEAVMFAPVTVIVPSSTLALDTVQLYTPSVLCLIVTVMSVLVAHYPRYLVIHSCSQWAHH